MSADITYPAPAKLNLMLRVTGRRADGYHLLQTVFRFIDYADALRFALRDDGVIARMHDVPGVGVDEDLALRAARLLQRTGATLTSSDQRQYHASSIESLTRSAFGWRFPVAGMRYWVLGQPAPGMTLAALERDDANRVTRLKQDDWQVAFNYAGPDASRPSRVEVAGADAEIRLVIDGLTAAQP